MKFEFRLVLLVVLVSSSVLFINQTFADDLWDDAPAANTGLQQQVTNPEVKYSEPDIQMWEINGSKDLYRKRPPANTFKDFRQGAIDFWIKYNSGWDARDEVGTIIALSNGYDTLFEFSMSADGTAIFMSNAEDDAINGERSRINVANYDFTDGLIHHVALVTENDITHMYVDGKSVGEFSLGYWISEDAKGQRRDLQLSIGSLDGRNNIFHGQVGAIRVWGVPLNAKLLFKSAFIRDQQLLQQGWVKSFLIAHLDNIANTKNKPKLNFLPLFFRPQGIWMTEDNQKRNLVAPKPTKVKFDSDGRTLNYAYKPQAYKQLILVSRDSELVKLGNTNRSVTSSTADSIAEQRCFGMVQNKVAWSTSGENSWNPVNIKNLCKGVGAGQEQARISCFSSKMPAMGWSAAISSCQSVAIATHSKDVSASIVDYVKFPGKYAIGELLQTTKMDLESCAEVCSGSEKCSQFTYKQDNETCYLINTRTDWAIVTNADTYVKAGDTNELTSVAKNNAESIADSISKSPLAVQAPKQRITNEDLPVLVTLTFTPNQADSRLGTPEKVMIEVYEPKSRNQYLNEKNRQSLKITGFGRMRDGSSNLVRTSALREPKKTDANVQDVFIVSNQIRGKDAVLTGYDPIKLDPLSLVNRTGGVKGLIFEHTQYGFNNGANRVVPLGLELLDVQSGKGRTKSTEVTTEEQLQSMLGGNVSVTAEVDTVKGGATFSGNAAFKATSSTLKRGNSAYTFAQTYQTRFVVLLDKSNIGLTNNFRQAVELAANRPSAQSAMSLVREFGTHYAQAAAMGGRLIQIVELDSTAWGAAITTEGSAAVAVEARIGPQGVAGGKVGASGGMQMAEMESFNSQVSNSSTNWITDGGQGGDANSWQATDETTTPIFLDLRPLSEILAPPFFTDPKVFNRLRPLVYKAIKQYIVQNKGNIQTTSNFVPKKIAMPVAKNLEKKSCALDKWSFRNANNTDSKMEGGGVWMRFKLPQGKHNQQVSFEGGCYASSHGDGWMDTLLECNRVCWKAASFRCNNGKWEHTLKKTSKQIFSSDLLCHSTGNTSQPYLEVSTGNAPWVFPVNLCELLKPGTPGRKNCDDSF